METLELDTRVGPVPVRIVGDGPPVLALHSFLLDGRLWDGMAERLAPHARVVLPDLPLGAHRRPVPDRGRLTVPEVAEAVVDVLDGLGIADAVLVGNDTGGAIAQLLTAAHPERVRGLVLAGCDAFEHFPPPLLRPLVPLAAVPGGTGLILRLFAIPAVLADPGPLNILSTRGLGRSLVRDLLRPARTDPGVRADVTALLRSIDPAPLLAAADALPLLAGRAAVLWGRHDRVFPPRDGERLAALLDTTVTWLDDALTFVPIDRPDAVTDAVHALLAVGEPDTHAS